MKKTILLSLAALTVLTVPLGAQRSARPGDDGKNVLLTLTLAGVEGSGEQPIKVLLVDGERTRVTTGWRIPTPTAATGAPEASAGAATPLQYQEVGLDVTLNGRIVGPGRVRVSGEVDQSTIARDPAAPPNARSAPTIATFRHVFDAILADGVRTTLAEAPDADGDLVTLTLTAEIR